AQGSRLGDQLRQAEQLIEADVRNSLQAVRSGEARLASAAASRASAEQQYESQQRQFRAGTTTVFLVLQAQTALLTARANELEAQTTLNKAISQLQHAIGNTLKANNVAVINGATPRELDIREPPPSDSVTTGNAFAPAQTTPANAKFGGRP